MARLEDLIGEVRGFIEKAASDPGSVDADAFHASKEVLDHESVLLHETSIAASLRAEER